MQKRQHRSMRFKFGNVWFSSIFLLILTAPYITHAWSKSIQDKNTQVQKHQTISPKSVMVEHTETLRELMLQLYTQHPQELAKSTQVGAREMTEWVFDGKANWKFDAMRNLQGNDALLLLFEEDDQRDHILPLVVGLETLLFSAYGAQNEFDIPQQVNPILMSQVRCKLQTFSQQLDTFNTTNKKSIEIFADAQSLNEIQHALRKIMQQLIRHQGISTVCE